MRLPPEDGSFCFEDPPLQTRIADWRPRLDALKNDHPGQWTKWLGVASNCAAAIRRRGEPAADWEVEERFIEGTNWTYVRYVQPSSSVPGANRGASPQDENEEEGFPRGSIERRVAGAMRDAINSHGPITKTSVGSATKRVVGALQSYGVHL